MFALCCKSFTFDGLKLIDMYGVGDTINFMICCLSGAVCCRKAVVRSQRQRYNCTLVSCQRVSECAVTLAYQHIKVI